MLGYTEASWNAELSDVKGDAEQDEHGAEAEAARPAAATWAEESPLTLDAQRLRAAFERDPALWDDLARLVVRVESALNSDLYTLAIACEPRRVVASAAAARARRASQQARSPFAMRSFM